MDAVHQGDLNGKKGVYHINTIDAVTQWEIVGCVEKISEHILVPILEDLLCQYPFVIKGFHSDNGSEYVNSVVVKLLNKLLAKFAKSRARRTNDQALVEGKEWEHHSQADGAPAYSSGGGTQDPVILQRDRGNITIFESYLFNRQNW